MPRLDSWHQTGPLFMNYENIIVVSKYCSGAHKADHHRCYRYNDCTSVLNTIIDQTRSKTFLWWGLVLVRSSSGVKTLDQTRRRRENLGAEWEIQKKGSRFDICIQQHHWQWLDNFNILKRFTFLSRECLTADKVVQKGNKHMGIGYCLGCLVQWEWISRPRVKTLNNNKQI